MTAWITKYGWTSTAWTMMFLIYGALMIALVGFIATN
jgi:hypothetical protein